MYFLLTTGRIIPESQMKIVYEIMFGVSADKEPEHYKKWINRDAHPLPVGVVSDIDKYSISIEQLLRGKCFGEALKLFRERTDCSFIEAAEALVKIESRIEEMNTTFKCGRNTHCEKGSCENCVSTVVTPNIYPCGNNAYCGHSYCNECPASEHPDPATNVRITRTIEKE